jgi:hypothetical protein
MMKSFLSAALFTILISNVNAQEFTLQGYLKDLPGWTDQSAGGTSIGTGTGELQNTLHNRLDARVYPSATWTFGCDLRTRFITEKGFNRNRAFTSALEGPADLVNLSAVLVDRDDAVLVSQVDRLYADWTAGPVELTLGRQRIAWGTNLVWNPTDLFNPFSVLDFDYEEHPGVDGLRAQLFTGPTSRIEIAVAPGRTAENRTVMGLIHLNTWEYDFSFLGGTYQEGYVLGFNWAGQLWGGGFRGEARWSGNQRVTDPSTPDVLRRSYLTAAVSGDYTFSNSLYLHTEVLYNGDGVNDDAGLRWLITVARGELSPAIWSFYQEVSEDITPLLRGSLFGLFNPDDGSKVIVPSLSYSVATNWDLLLIGLVAGGRPDTEFGRTGTSAFARIKWSF